MIRLRSGWNCLREFDSNGENMVFSVVIPVYNVEKYLEKCLDNIFGQTFDDYEVILVDDGSTDESGRICDKYALKHDNTKVIHKINQGLISARREGYRNASGEYIINCDSDDYLELNTLHDLYEVIKINTPDMIIYNSYLVYEDRKELFSKDLFSEGIIEDKKMVLDKLLLSASINSLCMKAYRRELIDLENDYSELYNVSHGEDLLQTVPLVINAEKIYYLNRQLYNYRTKSGMTAKYNNEKYWSFKLISNKIQKYMHDANVDELDFKTSKFIVQAAYDAIHINLEVGEFHENDVMDIIKDEEFTEAYKKIRGTKYLKLFTIKKRIILELIYYKLYGLIKWLFIKSIKRKICDNKTC